VICNVLIINLVDGDQYMSGSDLPINQSIQNISVINRVRRNHGLEHSTLHVLSEHFPGRSLAGHSDVSGFWIMGEVSLDDVYQAVEEALKRLRNGERKLAIHPNCGTNYVVSGVLAGVTGGLAMLGAKPSWQSKLERLPMAATLATLVLILSQPLGYKLQELTTSSQPGDLRVIEISAKHRGNIKAYRVVTQG
jgi:Domain of unknown function (DUF6391)